MAQLKCILWFLWSLLSLKKLESTKIYVVDIQEEDKTLPNAFDYDKHDGFVDSQGTIPTNYRIEHNNKKIIQDQDVYQDMLRNVIICCKRLGNFVDVNVFKRCLKSYSDYERSNGKDYFENTKEYTQYNSEYSNGENRNRKNKRLVDMTTFSADYLEVGDLGRSEKFADDYIDIGDLRNSVLAECSPSKRDQHGEITKTRCIPASRKANLHNQKLEFDQNFDNIEVLRSKKKKTSKHEKKPSRPISDSNSESSQASEESSEVKYIVPKKKEMSSEKEDESHENEDESFEKEAVSTENEAVSTENEAVSTENDNNSSEMEEMSPEIEKKTRISAKIKLPKQDKREHKLKRYKVISYKKDESVNNNDSDRTKIESESEHVDFSSDAELFPHSGLSEEVTTKKPRKGKFKKGAEDKYVYLQGNKLYDGNDFTRRRLSHLLPKRQHWKEEDFTKLGYFWFQGPKGQYPVS